MKTRPKFLKAIGAAFAGFRWLFALLAVVAAVKLVLGPKAISGTLTLAHPPQSLAIQAPPGADASIERLNVRVNVPVTSRSDSSLKAVARLGILPTILVFAIAGLGVCELARRLTRNFVAGELFSPRNARLLQSLAIVLVAGTVVTRLLTDWTNHLFARYAMTHLVLAGSAPLRTAENVSMPELTVDPGNADLIVLALFVLVVVAFRQGLALKQENDLTI